MEEEQMMLWFLYDPYNSTSINPVTDVYYDTAVWINENIAKGNERTVALRKLLESRDAAIRAQINPGR